MCVSNDRTSRYTKEHAAMLKEAISRPGVREAMEVYQNWRKVDGSLDSYRQVSRKRSKAVVSDSSIGI